MARMMLLVSSNNRIDRDGEIVTKQALADYVARAHNADGDYIGKNKLLWWHGGDTIGSIIECDLIHGFLVEIAIEAPNRRVTVGKQGHEKTTTVKAIWDMVEQDPNSVGVSIGGYSLSSRDADGVYHKGLYKLESSILPISRAGSIFTGAWIMG